MFEKKDRLESIIGANSHFEGEIKMTGTLRVDGKVTGNVQTDWLIVGEKAVVKGDITAAGIIVGGLVEGNLKAREIVEVKHKGRIKGDTATKKVSIVEGGCIDGRVSMREEAKLIELSKDMVKSVPSS